MENQSELNSAAFADLTVEKILFLPELLRSDLIWTILNLIWQSQLQAAVKPGL